MGGEGGKARMRVISGDLIIENNHSGRTSRDHRGALNVGINWPLI